MLSNNNNNYPFDPNGKNKGNKPCCNNPKLIKSPEGFTICENCGVQLSNLNLVNQNPYDPEKKTGEFLTTSGRTYIGNPMERGNEKFKRLEFIQEFSNRKYEDSVFKHAYMEMLGICSRIGLPDKFPKEAFGVFKKIWKQLPPNKMERSYENLVPVVIYQTAKINGINFELKELLSAMKCSEKKFKAVLIKTYNLFSSCNTKEGIRNRINKICDQMEMAGEIKIRALKILEANQNTLLATTPSSAACTSITMAVISMEMRMKYRPYKIGKSGGCSASAISARMRKVLINRGYKDNLDMKNLDVLIPNIYYKLINKSKSQRSHENLSQDDSSKAVCL
ncbi:MAG: hypothetical protein GY870_20520 [archaeon]|nr:hypothetical protein [archaeon]